MTETEARLRTEAIFALVLPVADVIYIDPINNPKSIHGEYGVEGNGFHFKLVKWPKHDELVLFHGDAVMSLPEGSSEGKYSATILNVMEGGALDEKYFDNEDDAWRFADQGTRRFFVNRETQKVREDKSNIKEIGFTGGS